MVLAERIRYDVRMGTKALVTIEQFSEMRFSKTEDYKLVQGELVPLSNGTFRHNKIRDLVGHPLRAYFQRTPIGEYLSAGSRKVWLVDRANREVQVHASARVRILQGSELLETPVLPGFSASLADFWSDL